LRFAQTESFSNSYTNETLTRIVHISEVVFWIRIRTDMVLIRKVGLKKYVEPGKLFFEKYFKPWMIQHFGSLLTGTCQWLIRGLVQAPIWTTTFILRKDWKKISCPFNNISIKPSSFIYSILYLWFGSSLLEII